MAYSNDSNFMRDETLCRHLKKSLKMDFGSVELRPAILALLSDIEQISGNAETGAEEAGSALDAIMDPVCLVDCHGRVVHANRAYAEQADTEVHDAIGRPCWELFPDLEGFSAPQRRIMHTYQERTEELRLATGEILHNHSYTVFDEENRALCSLRLLKKNSGSGVTEKCRQHACRALLVLTAVNRVLLQSDEEEDLLESVCKILVEQAGYSFAAVGYGESGDRNAVRPVVAVASGHDPEASEEDASRSGYDSSDAELARQAMCSRTPAIMSDLDHFPGTEPFPESSMNAAPRSTIVLPLVAEGTVLGALTIRTLETGRFDSKEEKFLKEIADAVAAGIRNCRRHERAAKLQDQHRALIERNPDAILIIDSGGIIRFANPAAENLLGESGADLVGTPFGLPLSCDGKTEIELLGRGREKDHFPRTAEMRLIDAHFGSGPKKLAFLHDTTDRHKAATISEHLGHILENSWNEIYTFDADTLKFLMVSKGGLNQLGYSEEEMRRLTPLDFTPEIDRDQFEALVEPLRQGLKEQVVGETVLKRWDGITYPVEVRLQLSNKHYRPTFIAIAQDISERRQHVAELEYKAQHDELTGLPNRDTLLNRLEQLLESAQQEMSPFAVLVVTIQRLSEINDLMGYQCGDRTLTEVANRLLGMCRDADIVARLSNTDFIVVLADGGYESAQSKAKAFKKALEKPVDLEEFSLEIEAAFGIAIFPDHGTDTTTLLRHADMAMRTAKIDNEGILVYTLQDDSGQNVKRLWLHGELRKAIDEGDLELHYQPKVDIGAKRVVGVEALARWPHRNQGMISPGEFIPMVEQSGLIRPFTEWVLEEAIALAGQWEEKGIDLDISVNLSVRNLLDPELPATLAGLLATRGVDPGRVCLEITESTLMFRPEQALEVLTRLHEMGVGLSIDDFGTGYSSLAYLKKLPVQELKIDRTFVFGLVEGGDDAVIVRSTIDLAHNLGIRTVAEGVENGEIIAMLEQLGCDLAQGYHVSRPLPREDLQEFLHYSDWAWTF